MIPSGPKPYIIGCFFAHSIAPFNTYKIMLLQAAVVFFLIFGVASSSDTVAIDKIIQLKEFINKDSCEFYTHVEALFPCDKDQYITRFANRYCNDFLNQRDNFVDQEWNNAVRVCLQEKMYQNLLHADQSTLTCKQIKKWGLDSHVPCYIRPNQMNPEIRACRLGRHPSDLVELVKIASPEWYQSAVWKQICDMGLECAGHYAAKEVQMDFRHYVEKLVKETGVHLLGGGCHALYGIDWLADEVVDGYDALSETIGGWLNE